MWRCQCLLTSVPPVARAKPQRAPSSNCASFALRSSASLDALASQWGWLCLGWASGCGSGRSYGKAQTGEVQNYFQKSPSMINIDQHGQVAAQKKGKPCVSRPLLAPRFGTKRHLLRWNHCSCAVKGATSLWDGMPWICLTCQRMLGLIY